jgi:hypothetical protein
VPIQYAEEEECSTEKVKMLWRRAVRPALSLWGETETQCRLTVQKTEVRGNWKPAKRSKVKNPSGGDLFHHIQLVKNNFTY